MWNFIIPSKFTIKHEKNFLSPSFVIVKGCALHKFSENFLYCGSRNILEDSDFTASCSYYTSVSHQQMMHAHLNTQVFFFKKFLHTQLSGSLAYSSAPWSNPVLEQAAIVPFLHEHWNNISYGRYVQPKS